MDVVQAENPKLIFNIVGGALLTVSAAVAPADLVAQHVPVAADVCVVGIPDEEWGERVGVWVEPTEEGATRAVLDAYLRALLSSPKIPRSYHFGAPVPRNANGKLDRMAVRRALS